LAVQIQKTGKNWPCVCRVPSQRRARNIYWWNTRHSIDSSGKNEGQRSSMDTIRKVPEVSRERPPSDTDGIETSLTPPVLYPESSLDCSYNEGSIDFARG
jgi:hypothetical protein